jgi:hypothetical protein
MEKITTDCLLLTFTDYSMLLAEVVNIYDEEFLEQYNDPQSQQIVKTAVSCLLEQNSEKNENLKRAILQANGKTEIILFLQQHNTAIKEKCINAIKRILEKVNIPNDIHSPKEMFILKLKNLLFFLNNLILLQEIDDQKVENDLNKILLSTIDKTSEATLLELKALERKIRERSFPSDTYYPWYLHIACEFDDTISFLIGDWKCKKLIDLLENISISIDFAGRKFAKQDEIYILIRLSELGFAKTSIKPSDA